MLASPGPGRGVSYDYGGGGVLRNLGTLSHLQTKRFIRHFTVYINSTDIPMLTLISVCFSRYDNNKNIYEIKLLLYYTGVCACVRAHMCVISYSLVF